MNWYKNSKFSQTTGLLQSLLALRPQMAQAAQDVYNSWEQDADGLDVDVGGGGICDEISQAMSSVIVSNIPGVDITEGGMSTE
jgi:hypothetical protein